MQGERIVIHRAAGEFDAQQIRAFLAAHGIDCEFEGESLRKTHGFTLNGLGEVEILVEPGDAPRARDLLERVASGELALADDEEAQDGGPDGGPDGPGEASARPGDPSEA